MIVRLPFPPGPAVLEKVLFFFAGILERGAETNLHGAMLIVREQLPDPTILKAVP